MKFGTRMLEKLLIVVFVVMTVLGFLLVTGALLGQASGAGVAPAAITNILLIISIGAQFLIAIILLRVYESLEPKKSKGR